MKDKKTRLVLIVTVSVIVVAVVAAVLWGGGAKSAEDVPMFTAERGPLTISIDESGTIKALDQEVVKCMVEGGTTILTVIPEGTNVKKGDLLMTLDASKFEDMLVSESITLQNAETTLISAEESLAVGKNQAESDLETAQLALEFAKEDLRKYEEGDYLNEVTDANAQIVVKEEAVQQARKKYEGSLRLFKDKYISETELKADELALSRASLEVTLAKNRRQLLKDFTYKRTMKQLTSDVWQAEMALERAKRKAKADVVLLEAALLEAKSTLEKQKDIVKKLETNITNTKITAPADGMVVYASSQRNRWGGSDEPLDEGQQVRERQELIHLPTSDRVKVEIKVHESSMQKIKVGLPVVVTVDALPEKVFTGTVAKIAMLPDAQMVWLNPDLKVYATEIHLDGEGNGLRTGMSCRASVIVKEYEDVVYIPVHAVVRIGKQPTVYVVKGGEPEPREIEIGLDNNRMVHVKSGLQEGEKVLLTPPLAPAEAQDVKARNALQQRRDIAPDDMKSGDSAERGAPQRDSGTTTDPGVRQRPAEAQDGDRQGGDASRRPGGQRPGGGGGRRPGGPGNQ
ncbi:MAG: HlyD family efflux transporter periplasmic adaptor subunit [Sedimentisphaerales bacterium]|nr:HlyD family efflux transporter periplasmic adaptor subunit [Sedimentisphaerales bacterium]